MIQDINNSSVRNTAVSKTQQSKQATKASSSAPPVIPKALAATGLPIDKLSASIISFARFFSLPLKPQLLADIRRQALMPQLQQNTTQQGASAQSAALRAAAANPPLPGESTQTQKSFTDVKAREAFSLAAAAAESKGVELNQKGLEAYTEAVDPDKRRQNDEDRQREKRDKNQNEDENIITAENIKKMALHNSENNPLLEILNKLPGKNGQHWIVLPFDFCEGGREYFVTMRVLLEEEIHTKAQSTQRAQRNLSQSCSYFVLDVLMKKGEEENRRVFIFESSNEKPVRVTVYVLQEMPAKDQNQIKKEVSKIFDIPIERVNIRTSEEAFPFEAGFCEPVTTVDEAV